MDKHAKALIDLCHNYVITIQYFVDYNPLIIKPIICELHVHVILLANNLWIAAASYSNQLCVFNNCFMTIQLFVDYLIPISI